MPVRYIKRYQMVFDAEKTALPKPVLPNGFFWVPWSNSVLETHARVKFNGFRGEMDADLFPSFSQYESCLRLMHSIVSREGFLPAATCLIAFGEPHRPLEYCANIQGVRLRIDFGAIQNVAVVPGYRKRGLGHALLANCLHGFHRSGVVRVSLEVTAENDVAVRLYKRLGFQIVKTVFKESFTI